MHCHDTTQPGGQRRAPASRVGPGTWTVVRPAIGANFGWTSACKVVRATGGPRVSERVSEQADGEADARSRSQHRYPTPGCVSVAPKRHRLATFSSRRQVLCGDQDRERPGAGRPCQSSEGRPAGHGVVGIASGLRGESHQHRHPLRQEAVVAGRDTHPWGHKSWPRVVIRGPAN